MSATAELTPEDRARLETMLRNLKRAVNRFYWQLAFPIGCHPFIEFAGLMSVFVTMCEESLAAGIDYSQATAHTGQALVAAPHHVTYLAEKFGCIFGPVVSDPKVMADFLCRLLDRGASKTPFRLVSKQLGPLELSPDLRKLLAAFPWGEEEHAEPQAGGDSGYPTLGKQAAMARLIIKPPAGGGL